MHFLSHFQVKLSIEMKLTFQKYANAAHTHGISEAVLTANVPWKRVCIIVFLAALGGMITQSVDNVIEYASSPKSTTVSPWFPHRLPDIMYCPSAVFRNDYVENQKLSGDHTEFFKAVAKGGFPTDNIPCMFMDGFHSMGKCFYAGRFSPYSTMDNNRKESDLYIHEEINKQLLMIDEIMRPLINDHLARRGISLQKMMDEISLNPYEVFNVAKMGNQQLIITKRFTKAGVCFKVEQPREMGTAQLRLRSYTVVINQHGSRVCHWRVPFDSVVFGDAASAILPSGLKLITFPGHYTFSIIPNRYKRLNSKKEPCLENGTTYESEACTYMVAGGKKWCNARGYCHDLDYDVIADGTVHYRAENYTSVDGICNMFDYENSCGKYWAIDENLDETVFGKCPMPCLTYGYSFDISFTPLANMSVITVQYSDFHQGLSYIQEWSITFGSMVSQVGGTMGLWCGITFMALAQLVYYAGMKTFEMFGMTH